MPWHCLELHHQTRWWANNHALRRILCDPLVLPLPGRMAGFRTGLRRPLHVTREQREAGAGKPARRQQPRGSLRRHGAGGNLRL